MFRALERAVACLFLLCSTAAFAQETGRVVEVIDGDTVVLADRREVRLVGIQAPKLPLGRRNFTPWPLAEESRAALIRLAAGKTLTLSHGGAAGDRHGRVLAHLTDESGRFIQAEMVRLGMARVYSFSDNRSRLDELFAAEREARAANRGIWSLPYYRIRTPEALGGDLDSFQLVEGRVLRAAAAGGRIFLNFGADPKTDFTAVIQSGGAKSFAAAGLDPLALSGRRIRVRGWIENRDGPRIQVTYPEQIELLDRP
jgi:endonuclease YncB( thermonuclease family)